MLVLQELINKQKHGLYWSSKTHTLSLHCDKKKINDYTMNPRKGK